MQRILLGGIFLTLWTPTLVLADADPGVVHVRLSKSDVGISFVESSGGMTVELKCQSASVCGRTLYIGDGSVAIPLTANNSGIWLQGKSRYRQGDRFRVDSTISVRPGYKSVRDLAPGNVYVVLPGVEFVLPKMTSNGDGRVFNLEPSTSGYRSVAFNSKGSHVVVSSVREVKTLDLETGIAQPSQQAIRPGSPVRVAFAPDDNHVATTGWYGVHLWNLKTGRAVLRMPDHAEQALKFMAGASATQDVAFHPDGVLIATAGKTYLTIWENRADEEHERPAHAKLRRRIKTSAAKNSHVTQVTFSSDGAHLATMSRNWNSGFSGFPTGIELWDVKTGDCLMRMQGGGGGLAFSPDGKLIASGERPDSKRTALWDVTTGEVVRKLEGHKSNVLDVAFHPNGKFVASASKDGTVRVWETANEKAVRVLTGHIGPVESLAWSSDGKRIASVSSKPPSQLIVWDLRIE